MRILPIAFIVVGTLGVAKQLGFIPVGMFHLIGPLFLIALGVALLFRRPRSCRSDWHTRKGGVATNSPQPPSAGLI